MTVIQKMGCKALPQTPTHMCWFVSDKKTVILDLPLCSVLMFSAQTADRSF